MTALAERLRARALGVGVRIGAPQAERIATYGDLLQRWNRRMNLTALPLDGWPDASLDRLLLEPVAAAAYIPDVPANWLDIGSGGGSPAIPLKLINPSMQLTLVESKSRKAAFLREAVRTLRLTGCSIENCRAEELSVNGSADVITLRAVRLDDELASVLRRLLRRSPSARILLFSSESAPGPVGFRKAAEHPLLGSAVLHSFTPIPE